MQMEMARQQTVNRRSSYATEPQTAGPTATTFMTRRASQAEQLKAQLHLNRPVYEEQQVPMTASLGGKFGGRLNPNATTFRMSAHFEEEDVPKPPQKTGSTAPANTPVTPSYGATTVISGGTSLGMAGGFGIGNGTGNGNNTPTMSTSKSDASLNWRRGAGNSTTVNNNTRSASLSVKITPPPSERVSPPPGLGKLQHRPEPLRFSLVINEPTQTTVVVDNSSDGEDADDTSSSSAKSEPTTPPSGGVPPLSPREAASKRLYEGLGIGRPVAQSAAPHMLSFPGTVNGATNVHAAPFTSVGMSFPGGAGQAGVNRIVSQPMRQPRGPPSNVDELGPKNFATRIRRKAIGGLGAMLDARVNRREVEAF